MSYLVVLRRLLAVSLFAHHIHANICWHQWLPAENELHDELVHQLRADLQQQQGLQKVAFRTHPGHHLAEKVQKSLRREQKRKSQKSTKLREFVWQHGIEH